MIFSDTVSRAAIIVNEKINTSLSYRKKIRQELYYCKKFGVASHLQRKQLDISEQDYLKKLVANLLKMLILRQMVELRKLLY